MVAGAVVLSAQAGQRTRPAFHVGVATEKVLQSQERQSDALVVAVAAALIGKALAQAAEATGRILPMQWREPLTLAAAVAVEAVASGPIAAQAALAWSLFPCQQPTTLV
jgi:hypothetical protein